MLQGFENIFDEKDVLLKHLKKESYEQNTEYFKNEYGHFFDEMFEYVDGSDDKESAAKEIADTIIAGVSKKYTDARGKISGRDQVDNNFFMIYYVFPTILSVESTDNKLIADAICNEWGNSFKDSKIQYTDYDSLYGSFRHKIFGIF